MTFPPMCVESTSRTTNTQMTSSPTPHAQPTALHPLSRYAVVTPLHCLRLHRLHLAACFLAFHASSNYSDFLCLLFFCIFTALHCRTFNSALHTSWALLVCWYLRTTSVQAVTLGWCHLKLCQCSAPMPASVAAYSKNIWPFYKHSSLSSVIHITVLHVMLVACSSKRLRAVMSSWCLPASSFCLPYLVFRRSCVCCDVSDVPD